MPLLLEIIASKGFKEFMEIRNEDLQRRTWKVMNDYEKEGKNMTKKVRLWRATKGDAVGGFETAATSGPHEYVCKYAPVLRYHCTVACGRLPNVIKSLKRAGWSIEEVLDDKENQA